MGTIAKALITLSVAVWAAGCSEPPTARADAAKARVAALAAEAQTYASAAYAEAQQAVARLDAELASRLMGLRPSVPMTRRTSSSRPSRRRPRS